MKKCYSISLMLLAQALFSFALLGQTISGRVTAGSTGETLPGVTIQVKGSTAGAFTDADGVFTIEAAPQGILTVSYLGFKPVEVAIAGRTRVDIVLEEMDNALEEVVVVGYGRQKKKVVTGAIATVTDQEIVSTPILRVEQALQGRTPGVQVTNQSGQPGEEPTVRVRGIGTTGNARPLYIVDGLPVSGIDYLNPGDIESIDVLKDAASAAIYGARAANGVVLITTRSGKAGKATVSYSGYYGVQNAVRNVTMLDAEQYRLLMNEGARNAGFTEPFDLNEIPAHNTDWQDALFVRNAPMSNHQVTITGGNEKTTYASSLSLFSQEGIIGGEKSKFDRITGRFNSTHQVNRMFRFGNNVAYTHIVRRGIASNQSFNGAYSSALNLDPLTPVFETDPNILSQPPFSNEPVVRDASGRVYGISRYVGAEVVNPLALLEIQHAKTRKDQLVGNIFGELEPIAGLKLISNFGVDLAYLMNDGFRPLFYLNGAQLNVDKTSVNKSIARFFTWQWENTLSYGKRINDHNFNVLVGTTATEFKFEDLSGFNADVPTSDPNNVYLNLATDTTWQAYGGASHSALFSLFGRLTYDYKDRYSVTAILRRDGSSKFGANNRYGMFPSFGVAWILSEEAFFPKWKPLDILKLRASWGVNGNQEIGNYQFVSTIDNSRGYTIGPGRALGSSPLFLENADIRWEESKQIDIGMDASFFQGRLSATADYYIKTTSGLLERIPIPAHVGNDGPVANVGSVENRGVELALNWRNASKNFKYSVGINGSYNKNQMTKIGNEEKVIPGATWAIAGQVTRSEVGQPIAYFWGYQTAGIFQNQTEVFSHLNADGQLLQPNAVPGDVRFVDVNGDGVINADDRTFIGNPTPDWTFGFNASFEYKNFDFSLFIQGTQGNEIFNGMQRQDLRYTNRTTEALGRWTGEGTSNSIPRYTWIDVNNNYRVSDLYIEDGSHIRFRNIQLGYTLPKRMLNRTGVSAWRFYVSGENLLTLTKYTGADPEIGAQSAFDIGIDRGIYPQARTMRFGTTLTF